MSNDRPITAMHGAGTEPGGHPIEADCPARPRPGTPGRSLRVRARLNKSSPRRSICALHLSAIAFALTVAACGGGGLRADHPIDDAADLEVDAEEMLGPVDLGWGPGIDRPTGRVGRNVLSASGAAAVPAPINGGPLAHLKGMFGPVFNWPIIPIHVVLLPDGRILSYGSNQLGQQGGKHYTVWDPTVGEESDAMLTLKYRSETIIFCNTQLLLPGSGQVLLLGGNRMNELGQKVDASDVDVFDPLSNSLARSTSSMAFARWYGTVVTTAAGDQVVMGGRQTTARAAKPDRPAVAATYASTPEVYRPGQGWRTLEGATDEFAYGATEGSWWYPYAWQAPDGSIFVMSSQAGRMYRLDTGASGSLSAYPTRLSGSSSKMPSVMFAPGKVLSLRTSAQAVVVDINGAIPVVSKSQPTPTQRLDQSATLLADGKVWVNGGSVAHLKLDGAFYASELWDPAAGTWTTAATAAKARLYHSTSILLADGRVLTGGGGAPGPVTNLNAEIYFPPYLFRPDGSGELATRPSIDGAPDRTLHWGEVIPVGVSAATPVSRVTFVRTGSVTHTFNNEQRFIALDFVQSGPGLEVTLPSDRRIAPPGYYLLFVFDANGVPSVGKVMHLSDA